MDYSKFTSIESSTFLSVVNAIRQQNNFPPYIFENYKIPDENGFFGQYNYINEIQFFFQNPYLFYHFKKLLPKNYDVFMDYDNIIFSKVMDEYQKSNNLPLFNWINKLEAINEYFSEFNIIESLDDPTYAEDDVNLWFNMMNAERQRKGYDPILIPNNVEEPMRWFWDEKVLELPEFNTKEAAKLHRELLIWVINHLIFDTDGAIEEVVCLGAYTNKDDAFLSFTSLTEVNPDQIFFLSELRLNQPIELYLPSVESDWPQFMQDMAK